MKLFDIMTVEPENTPEEYCSGHCGACDEKHRTWEAENRRLLAVLAKRTEQVKNQSYALVDYQEDKVAREAFIGEQTEAFRQLKSALKEAVEALRDLQINLAYVYTDEGCGDHCHNNCRMCALANTRQSLQETVDYLLTKHPTL